MPYFLTLFISLLLLTSCYGKEEVEKYSQKNKTTDWQYRKTSLQEIQKKLINIEHRAMYVRLEKRYYQKGKGTEVLTCQLSQELKKDLLKEWKSARDWSTRTKNGFCFTPAFFYKLDFLDKNKNCIESMNMDLWYKPKGKLNFSSVEEKILSLFHFIRRSTGSEVSR